MYSHGFIWEEMFPYKVSLVGWDGDAAVPMVEAMVALVLVDQLMAQHGQCNLFPIDPDLQEPMFLAGPDPNKLLVS